MDTRPKRRTAGRLFSKLWLPVVALVVAVIVSFGLNPVRRLSEVISNPPETKSFLPPL